MNTFSATCGDIYLQCWFQIQFHDIKVQISKYTFKTDDFNPNISVLPQDTGFGFPRINTPYLNNQNIYNQMAPPNYNPMFTQEFIRSWNVEIWCNSRWIPIKKHVNDNTFNIPYQTKTFNVNNVNMFTDKIRWIMTNVNTAGTYNLRCCGIELYGKIQVNSDKNIHI